MAKIIRSDVDSQLFSAFYPFWRIVITGVVTGLVFWGSTEIINNLTIWLSGLLSLIFSTFRSLKKTINNA